MHPGRVAANAIRINVGDLQFEHESEGGRKIAEVSAAMATARPPPEAIEKRAGRFLQQRSFVRPDNEFHEAKDGFFGDIPLWSECLCGTGGGLDSIHTAFPVEKLPPNLDSWTLTVWLSEPDHLPAPIKRQIELPRDGNGSECEFATSARAPSLSALMAGSRCCIVVESFKQQCCGLRC